MNPQIIYVSPRKIFIKNRPLAEALSEKSDCNKKNDKQN
jgi:hypothetical protein